jgi:hypothetical protein
MIENVLCTIGANNFLDVKLFVPTLAACQQHCDQTDGCRSALPALFQMSFRKDISR